MINKDTRAAITKAIKEWFNNNPTKKNIDLAKHFNVSEMTASRWHKGENVPDLDLLPMLLTEEFITTCIVQIEKLRNCCTGAGAADQN